MVTVAVAAILISLAIPSFSASIRDNKISSVHNLLVSSLNLARSTAITRGLITSVCKSNATGSQCAPTSTDWSNGWLVFTDSNSNGSIDTGDTVIQHHNDIPSGISIKSSKQRFSFGSQGYARGFAASVRICDARKDTIKKGFLISNLGRIRIAESSDTMVSCNAT